MLRKLLARGMVLALAVACPVWAGSFGKVVAIGGQASDLALDESRGVLYIANFTANRIDVMSLSDNTVHTSINVAPQPSSMAISPDAHYLVVTHFGNNASPAAPNDALTVIDLTSNGIQTFALNNPPLGVAFGIDGRALVVTTTDYELFDPLLGTTQEIATISGVAAQTLPVPPANFPPQITTASVTSSGDGMTIYGIGGSTATFTFKYDVTTQTVRPGGIVTTSGLIGPVVVSGNQDGSLFMAGWVMVNTAGTFVNYFPQHSNQLNIGTSAFDPVRNLIYTQIPQTIGAAPVLTISDVDNLTVEQQLQLPENTSGKSVLSSNANTLYAVSESGVLVMPVGSLAQLHRLAASQEDLFFSGNTCTPGVASQNLTISDPGGGSTSFTISSDTPGVTVSPASGTTPATVKVSVDPGAFLGQNGTAVATLTLSSAQAVNVAPKVRVLVNLRGPNQTGTIFDVPGTLVDLLADPARNQFYVLRQDKNEVLVFNGATYSQIASLRTGNLPASMAITFDGQNLLVGNAGSQIVNVYDLNTLQQTDPILLPSGHIALSLASSANATLAATEFYDGTHHIVRLNLNSRTGVMPAKLGIFQNQTDSHVALSATPNGSAILAVEGNGSVLLYDAVQDTFTVSRQDFTSLSGAYAASAFNQYIVGNSLLNSSLVPVAQFGTSNASSGFAFVNQSGFWTTVPQAVSSTSGGSGTSTSSSGTGSSSSATPTTLSSAAGTIQLIDLTGAQPAPSLPSMMAEAPLVGTGGASPSPFSRTVAPLYNQSAIINLTVSGFTVLAWQYEASEPPPQIDRVVSAADQTSPVAPGGLISILGDQLSPVNLATQQVPLPTALGDSCLAVNGQPIPILFVSPNQINAQLPFGAVGNVTFVLRTPGGISNNYNVTVLPGAPAVFLSGTAGPLTGIATIIRQDDNQLVTASNPIHRGDTLVIYLTGLGLTNPAVPTGQPAPSNPAAAVIAQPRVTLGGVNLPMSFAGLVPGEIGVYQINVSVPKNVPTGLDIPLQINQSGQTATLSVRVVS